MSCNSSWNKAGGQSCQVQTALATINSCDYLSFLPPLAPLLPLIPHSLWGQGHYFGLAEPLEPCCPDQALWASPWGPWWSPQLPWAQGPLILRVLCSSSTVRTRSPLLLVPSSRLLHQEQTISETADVWLLREVHPFHSIVGPSHLGGDDLSQLRWAA